MILSSRLLKKKKHATEKSPKGVDKVKVIEHGFCYLGGFAFVCICNDSTLWLVFTFSTRPFLCWFEKSHFGFLKERKNTRCCVIRIRNIYNNITSIYVAFYPLHIRMDNVK